MASPVELFTLLAKARLNNEQIIFGTDNDGVLLPINSTEIDQAGINATIAQMSRLEGVIITGRDFQNFQKFAQLDPNTLPIFIATHHGAEFIIFNTDKSIHSTLLVEGITKIHEEIIVEFISSYKNTIDDFNQKLRLKDNHKIILEEKLSFSGIYHLGFCIQVRPAVQGIYKELNLIENLKAAQEFIKSLCLGAEVDPTYYLTLSLASLKRDSLVIAHEIINNIEKSYFHPAVEDLVMRLPKSKGAPIFKMDIIECDTGIRIAGLVNKGEILEKILTKKMIGDLENPFFDPHLSTGSRMQIPIHVIYTGDDFFPGDNIQHAGTDYDARKKGLDLLNKGVIKSYHTIQIARNGKGSYENDSDLIYIAGEESFDLANNHHDTACEINKRACAEHGRFKEALEMVLANPKYFLEIKDDKAQLQDFFAKFNLTGKKYIGSETFLHGCGLFKSHCTMDPNLRWNDKNCVMPVV